MTKKIMMWLGAALVIVSVVFALVGQKFGVSTEVSVTVLSILSIFIGRLGFDKVREIRRARKEKQAKDNSNA